VPPWGRIDHLAWPCRVVRCLAVAGAARSGIRGTATIQALAAAGCAVQALRHGPDLESPLVINWLRARGRGCVSGPAAASRKLQGPLQLETGSAVLQLVWGPSIHLGLVAG